MSVDITINDDGRIEARHNSGRVLWVRDIDIDNPPSNLDEAASDAVRAHIDLFWDAERVL